MKTIRILQLFLISIQLLCMSSHFVDCCLGDNASSEASSEDKVEKDTFKNGASTRPPCYYSCFFHFVEALGNCIVNVLCLDEDEFSDDEGDNKKYLTGEGYGTLDKKYRNKVPI